MYVGKHTVKLYSKITVTNWYIYLKLSEFFEHFLSVMLYCKGFHKKRIITYYIFAIADECK